MGLERGLKVRLREKLRSRIEKIYRGKRIKKLPNKFINNNNL
jgi:hypothetical protein